MAEPALTEANAAEQASQSGLPKASTRIRVETDKLTAMYGKFTAVKGRVALLRRRTGCTR